MLIVGTNSKFPWPSFLSQVLLGYVNKFQISFSLKEQFYINSGISLCFIHFVLFSQGFLVEHCIQESLPLHDLDKMPFLKVGKRDHFLTRRFSKGKKTSFRLTCTRTNRTYQIKILWCYTFGTFHRFDKMQKRQKLIDLYIFFWE